MARLRFVKNSSAQSVASAALNNTVRSIRVVYETLPAITKALLPQPLQALAAPQVWVQFAHVAMHVSPTNTVEIGAVTVGIPCTYNGAAGIYVLGMYMPGEFVCIKGRERFGEPKKQAVVRFDVKDNRFDVGVSRHGIEFMQITGEIGASTGPRQFEEHLFCYKAMPKISGEAGFDGSCFLTRLNWKRNYSNTCAATGSIVLRESPNDPLIDLPVQRMVSVEYVEGATQTGGQVLQEVPGEWLIPFFHARYDEPNEQGIEV